MKSKYQSKKELTITFEDEELDHLDSLDKLWEELE